MFLVKGVLKICSKFTGEHSCRSVISIQLLEKYTNEDLKISLCFRVCFFKAILFKFWILTYSAKLSSYSPVQFIFFLIITAFEHILLSLYECKQIFRLTIMHSTVSEVIEKHIKCHHIKDYLSFAKKLASFYFAEVLLWYIYILTILKFSERTVQNLSTFSSKFPWIHVKWMCISKKQKVVILWNLWHVWRQIHWQIFKSASVQL